MDGSKYEQHRPRLETKKKGLISRRILPPAVAATWRFLPIRELTITLKFLSFFIGVKRPPNVWTLTNVDSLKGWGARLKEALVNERGRYLFLELSLREQETMEVLYQPKENTWSSIAFVTRSTRTLGYMNLCRIEPDAGGLIRLKVSPDVLPLVTSLSTRGRRTGTLILREVSTDGRSLSKDLDMPRAVIHRQASVVSPK